jgi:hypothetical protein
MINEVRKGLEAHLRNTKGIKKILPNRKRY